MLKGKTYAELYDKHYAAMEHSYETLLPDFLDQLKWSDNETILDHGCATGRTLATYVLPRLAGLNANIYGIDISKSMIEFANKKYADPRVTYIQTDLVSDSFPPSNDIKFDKIFSLHVVHFDTNYKETLKKMYELLVPGGKLLLMLVSNGIGLFDAHTEITGHEYEACNTVHKKKHSPDWLTANDSSPENDRRHFEKILTEIGFKFNEMNTYPTSFVFATKKDCIELFTSADPDVIETVLEHDDHHEEFQKKWRQYLADILGHGEDDDDKEFQFFYDNITVLAEKPEV